MSDDDEKTEMEFEGLDKLARVFKKVPVVNVGILGDGARAATGTNGKAALSNSQIGAFHEFGTVKTPMRSFLRIPLIDNLDKRLEQDGVINKKAIEQAIKVGTLLPIMQQVGVIAEGIVLDAFDTGGFGKWAPLSGTTMAHKKNQQILVETQQLRNSITNEVVDGEGEE